MLSKERTKLFDPTKVTLEMVAARAGVSPSTVSRILNGTAVVSREKRVAVENAIAELNFVPNPVARGLAGGRSLSVGVVTQAIDSPFYGGALRSIEDRLGVEGYSALFVSGHWNARTEAQCLIALRSRRVDGVIVLTGRTSDAGLVACAKTLPVVVTGRSLKAPNLFSLNVDQAEGARLATQHLLALGHRDIAFICGDPRHADSKQRLQGYKAALCSAGCLPNAELILMGDYTESSGLAAAEKLIASGKSFTAIFAANDQMAYGARLALHRHHLHVPNDVSLVGFDDLASSVYAIPPLTTVHQSIEEIGQLAAVAMLKLLAGESPALIAPPAHLVERESTASAKRMHNSSN